MIYAALGDDGKPALEITDDQCDAFAEDGDTCGLDMWFERSRPGFKTRLLWAREAARERRLRSELAASSD